jgi:hypothetical protein
MHLANTRRIIGAVAGGVVTIALMPVLAPAVLGIFGFGAAGPVAGKPLPQAEVASNNLKLLGGIAAGIQAGIGNVAAGSAFAVAQSIAMGGAIPAAVTAVGAGVGAAAGAAAAGAGSDDEDTGEGEDPADDDAGDDDAGEGPAGGGPARTGRDRCPECQRRRVRVCRHP